MFTSLRRNLLLLLPLLAGLAFAQEAPVETESIEEEEEIVVVVTADRRPVPVSESIATVTVITARDIRAIGAQTLPDVLRIVPGSAIRQSGTPGALVTTGIRGSNSNQVLVLVDGQRISSPAFFGGTDPSKFPVTNISRIEIMRGPASSLYGSEAFGGVVNIITRQPTHTSFQAVYGAGHHGRTERALTVQGPAGNANWQVNASLPAFDGVRPNSDYAAVNLSGKVVIPELYGWTATLNGEEYHDKLGLPGADPFHTGLFDPDDRQWWNRERLDLTLKRDLSFGDLELRAYQNKQQLHNLWITDDPFYPAYGDSRITGKTKAFEALVRGEHGAHTWAAGLEYRDDGYLDIERGTYADPSQERQEEGIVNRALFLQDRWSITPTTDLVAGARLDDHSTAGSKLIPRLGVNHRWNDISLRASYAEGFRAPNFVELYYPEGPYGPGYTGNPYLRPETSRQYEIGVSRRHKGLAVDLALFTASVRDLIAATAATPYDNVGRSRQRGVELNLQHRFTPKTALDFSYTCIEAINRTSGERLAGRPNNTASLTATTGLHNWEIALTGRWVDDCPDLIFNPDTYASEKVTLPDFTVFNLSLTRLTNGPVQPYVTVRNLFNRKYEEVAGYAAEGFSLESGVRMMW